MSSAAPAQAAVLAAHSAPTENTGDLTGWVVGLVILVAVVYWLMRQGWKWRATLQSGLPPLPALPPEHADPILELEGRYHGSTAAGKWLDRIVARDLGTRSLVELTLTEEGLRVVRPASTDFFVPRSALRGARTDRAIAGKVLPEGGLLVVTWEHGGTLLDSGFRSEHPEEHLAWVAAVERLLPPGSGTPDNHADDNAAQSKKGAE